MSYKISLDSEAGNWQKHPLASTISEATGVCSSYCYQWFGLPGDPEWDTFVFLRKNDASCTRVSVTKSYVIMLPTVMPYTPSVYRYMSHEMSHRFLIQRERNSLLKAPWVNEMLAMLVQWKMLEEIGFAWYVRIWLEEYATRPALDLNTLKKAKPNRRGVFSFFKSRYPKGFYEGISAVGQSLASVVDWETLCRFPFCRTWEEWFDLLPRDKLSAVKTILRL